ncbi:MAG: tRNA (N6-threonylcarbamoyladenosine(37)-N6)-methyltransferase TrmO [Myxococcota bacterium]
MPKLPPKDYINAVPFPSTVSLRPIGIVHSPYTERHGTPRQSQLRHAPESYTPVEAQIELFKTLVPSVALKDLDGFSRIWVIAWLHLNKNWNPTVTPPRGPKIKRGTLATRAPHRPNPIGLSAPELIDISDNVITVRGIDLLNGTPILDIKPYVAYCDSFPNASSGYVDELDAIRAQERDIIGVKSEDQDNS